MKNLIFLTLLFFVKSVFAVETENVAADQDILAAEKNILENIVEQDQQLEALAIDQDLEIDSEEQEVQAVDVAEPVKDENIQKVEQAAEVEEVVEVVEATEVEELADYTESVNILLEIVKYENLNQDEALSLEELQARAEKRKAELAAAQEQADKIMYKNLMRASLFYSVEVIEKIAEVKEAAVRGVELEVGLFDEADMLAEVEVEQEVKTKNVVSFYLNSILFFGEEQWVIWLNDNRISADKNSSELEIISIATDYVRFKWVTGYAKFVDWLEFAKENNNLPFDTSVEIIDNIATVEFGLEPNQSFEITDGVFIREGRIKKD